MVHILVCRLLDASVNFSRRPGSPWCADAGRRPRARRHPDLGKGRRRHRRMAGDGGLCAHKRQPGARTSRWSTSCWRLEAPASCPVVQRSATHSIHHRVNGQTRRIGRGGVPPLGRNFGVQNCRRPRQAEETVPSVRMTRATSWIDDFCSSLNLVGTRKMCGGARAQIFDRLRVIYVSRDLKA
jgi:hypothetical protein